MHRWIARDCRSNLVDPLIHNVAVAELPLEQLDAEIAEQCSGCGAVSRTTDLMTLLALWRVLCLYMLSGNTDAGLLVHDLSIHHSILLHRLDSDPNHASDHDEPLFLNCKYQRHELRAIQGS